MAICIQKHVERHVEMAGGLPRIGAALHEPRRRRVPESMRRDSWLEFGKFNGLLECRPRRGCRLPVICDEMLRLRCEPVPSAKMRQQPWRKRNGWLSFVGSGVSLLQTIIIYAPLKIDIGPADGRNRRSDCDSAGAGACVETDQNKAREMTKRPFVGSNFFVPSVRRDERSRFRGSARTSRLDQFRGVRPCQPSVARIAPRWQCHFDKTAMTAFAGVMIDGGTQILQIAPRATLPACFFA